MTIRQFRDAHQKTMSDPVLWAGEYLERLGLVFGRDFVTGDALDIAAKMLTEKYDEQEWEEKVGLARRSND